MSPWPQIDALMAHAASSVRLLAAVTPLNAAQERARLVRCALRSQSLLPAWQYAPPNDSNTWVPSALLAASKEIRKRLPRSLANVYLARIEEIDLELRVTRHAGQSTFAPLARERFGAASGRSLRLAQQWVTVGADSRGRSALKAGVEASQADEIISDSRHPLSLLSLMRQRVSELKLDFQVVVHPSLASLAATGDRTIYVAAERRVSVDAARRTVLHETLAHALPRARARLAPLGIFSFGTARGQDDQEGYALWLEQKHHHLGAARRLELGARHLAVRAMREGADFGEVVVRVRSFGFDALSAVTIAERVFRGGPATREGLGREAIYLGAFVRVRDAIAADETLARSFSMGQVSLRAAATLAPLLSRALVAEDCRA